MNIVKLIKRLWCKHKVRSEYVFYKNRYIGQGDVGKPGTKLRYDVYIEERCDKCNKTIHKSHKVAKHQTEYQLKNKWGFKLNKKH